MDSGSVFQGPKTIDVAKREATGSAHFAFALDEKDCHGIERYLDEVGTGKLGPGNLYVPACCDPNMFSAPYLEGDAPACARYVPLVRFIVHNVYLL